MNNAPMSYNGAGVLVLGILMLLVGGQFDDPKTLASLNSPLLGLLAIAMHLSGGILIAVGSYRLYKSRRGAGSR